MKLNLNAKELLALHNLLYDRFESSAGGTCYNEGSSSVSGNQHLIQIYNRLKSCIVSALGDKPVDPLVDAFLSKEQQKIDQLEQQLLNVKKEQGDLAAVLKEDANFFEHVEGEYDLPEYPRRGAKNRGRGQNQKR